MSGRLVRRQTPAMTNDRRGAGTASPKQGARVELWQLDGRWAVWSDGPTRGTRWLLPHDDVAREIMRAVELEGDAIVAPVVAKVWRRAGGTAGAILVACSELRPALRLRGEA